MNFLETKNLSKTYPNGVEAVKSINLKIDKGEIYGLIGPNGAGKSTTIRILMGILEPTSGSVHFDGSSGIDLAKTGYLPECANFYRFMTIREYLEWSCSLYDLSDCETNIEESLITVGLENLRERKLDEISKGQKQRVGIAQALVHDPDLLILDEPTSGLDPLGKKKILTIIKGLADQGKTILTSSHILPELSQVCTGVGIIRDGELVLQGLMADLRKEFVTSNLELGFESSAGTLIEEIESLDFVSEVEEMDGERTRYIVRIKDEKRAKKDLPRVILDSEAVVTYYDFAQVTLEDIFMETMEEG
ncbi:MAG: ABC transporter ATP-binding protein [Candidatus Bipolaricaulota bacterium]|nr:ABC transporter ATP-binding protein [Candidatus Bipolaricaulota bacterium]MBS3792763.1 ABC transporter ATP-binding protein [Candidatus Bipolaricaulota bacterium]